MTAVIYTGSVQTVLRLMEESTAHLYYAAELQGVTGLSKPTVSKVLGTLCERGVLRKQPERVAYFMDRAPRIYYELTPFGVSALRLTPPST